MTRRHLFAGCVIAMVAGRTPLAFTLYTVERQDGARSPTSECSTRHWLNPLARVKSSLSLKTHGLFEREPVDKTTDKTIYEWTQRRKRGLSSIDTPDARIRRFYSTLPPLTLAPPPIWRMKYDMKENTSPTHSSGRKTSIGLVPGYLFPPLSRYIDLRCGLLRCACSH